MPARAPSLRGSSRTSIAISIFVTRATRLPKRVITTSSPFSTKKGKAESWALAFETFRMVMTPFYWRLLVGSGLISGGCVSSGPVLIEVPMVIGGGRLDRSSGLPRLRLVRGRHRNAVLARLRSQGLAIRGEQHSEAV